MNEFESPQLNNQGLSKKERRELKKTEKQARLVKTQRSKNFKKVLVWLVVLGGIGALVYFLIIVPITNRPPDLGPPEILAKQIPVQGANHINFGSSHPPYSSNPPTSGWHYPDPANWGFYDKELPDEQFIHNLEHGGIWIAYRPDLDPALIDSLEEAAKSFRRRIVMAPRVANDEDIALVAWSWLDKFSASEFSEKRVVDFIREFIDQGPEKVPF